MAIHRIAGFPNSSMLAAFQQVRDAIHFERTFRLLVIVT